MANSHVAIVAKRAWRSLILCVCSLTGASFGVQTEVSLKAKPRHGKDGCSSDQGHHCRNRTKRGDIYREQEWTAKYYI